MNILNPETACSAAIRAGSMNPPVLERSFSAARVFQAQFLYKLSLSIKDYCPIKS